VERPDLDALLAQETFLRAIARPLVDDESSVDDVVQETWLRAIAKPPRRRASLRAWLATVARNVALQSLRARRRRDRRERAAARPEGDDVVARVDGHRRVVDAVLGLPEPYRTTVLLRFYDRLATDAIGERLGVSGAAVRKRLQHAFALLRDALDEQHDGDRAAWTALLVPLLSRTETASAVAITGGLVVGTKLKLGIVALLLLLLAGAGWRYLASSPRPARARPAAAVAERPERAESSAVVPAPAMPEPIDPAAVDRDRDVFGVVVGVDGQPVAGATVDAVFFAWRRVSRLFDDGRFDERPGPSTRTARDGSFALRLHRGELTHLRASAPGLATRDVPRVQAGERVRIVLAPPVRLAVVARDEQEAAVAGAIVRLECAERGDGRVFFRRTGTTDADGRCSFADLAGGEGAWVIVQSERLGHDRARVGLPESGTQEVVVTLRAGRTVRGRVIDDTTSEPVAGARVGPYRADATVADGSGRFELHGVTRGKVLAGAAGYATGVVTITSAQPLDYRADRYRVSDASELEIRLVPGRVLTGRVVDRAGTAVAGALLAIKLAYATTTGVTDADGGFRLTDVAPGRLDLAVVAAGHGRGFVPIAPDAADLGTIVLPPAGAIEGRVLTPDGQPVPHAWVTVTHASLAERRRSDDLGRYRFPDLEPGTYAMWAEPDGIPPVKREVELPEGVARLEADLRYESLHPFVVRVETSDGLPVAGAVVHVSAAMRMADATTGADGRATVRLQARARSAMVDPPSARFRRPLAQWFEEEVNEARFVLEEDLVVRGRVVDPEGRPVGMAAIDVCRDDRQLEAGSSNPDGTFRVSVPDADAVDLVLTGHSFAPPRALAGRDHLMRGRLTGVRAGATDLVLEAARVAARNVLRVRVLSPDGQPMAGVRAVALPAACPYGVETDAEGRATLANLPAEEVRVTARQSRTPWLDPVPVTVVPAGQEIEMRCREPVTIEGRVTRDGAPAKYASVECASCEPCSADAEGRFRLKLEPDVAGPVRLRAFLTRDVEYEGVVDRAVPGSRGVEIRLVPMR